MHVFLHKESLQDIEYFVEYRVADITTGNI